MATSRWTAFNAVVPVTIALSGDQTALRTNKVARGLSGWPNVQAYCGSINRLGLPTDLGQGLLVPASRVHGGQARAPARRPHELGGLIALKAVRARIEIYWSRNMGLRIAKIDTLTHQYMKRCQRRIGSMLGCDEG